MHSQMGAVGQPGPQMSQQQQQQQGQMMQQGQQAAGGMMGQPQPQGGQQQVRGVLRGTKFASIFQWSLL